MTTLRLRRSGGLGLRLARELFVEVSGIVDECRHDHRRLLHILFLDAVKEVLVRVVRARFVFDIVLDELEAGEADAVERLVVGSAGV